MVETNTGWRFYQDLAAWWPLVSPVADYRDEATFVAELFLERRPDAKTMLELGAGGGHNAHYLKDRFSLTLTDLSEPMLGLSKGLNPECEHVPGDMRSLRLDRSFDAVFVHDAIDYMTTEHDLAAAFATAAAHLEAGGIAVFMPDDLRETFDPVTNHDGSDGPDGRGVRFLEWTHDPDPDDTEVVTEYVFCFRQPDGAIQVVHESHHTGLFTEDTWLRLLGAAGFAVDVVQEITEDERAPRRIFVGEKR